MRGFSTPTRPTEDKLSYPVGRIIILYLSKLRRDSVGPDFQSVRKLTNYVCAKPPESRLSVFRDSS